MPTEPSLFVFVSVCVVSISVSVARRVGTFRLLFEGRRMSTAQAVFRAFKLQGLGIRADAAKAIVRVVDR